MSLARYAVFLQVIFLTLLISLYAGHPISAMEDGLAWRIINKVFMNVIIQHDKNLLEEEDK